MLRYDLPNILGCFRNDRDVWFSYSATENHWALSQGLKQEIHTQDGVRFARVLKTVVYVAVDEDEEGNAVLEKWDLTRHELTGQGRVL